MIKLNQDQLWYRQVIEDAWQGFYSWWYFLFPGDCCFQNQWRHQNECCQHQCCDNPFHDLNVLWLKLHRKDNIFGRNGNENIPINCGKNPIYTYFRWFPGSSFLIIMSILRHNLQGHKYAFFAPFYPQK